MERSTSKMQQYRPATCTTTGSQRQLAASTNCFSEIIALVLRRVVLRMKLLSLSTSLQAAGFEKHARNSQHRSDGCTNLLRRRIFGTTHSSEDFPLSVLVFFFAFTLKSSNCSKSRLPARMFFSFGGYASKPGFPFFQAS